MRIPDKVQRAIEGNRWRALVVIGVESVQYCSGAWIPNARGYLDRQNILVWPSEGEPSYITGAELISGVESPYIDRFVGYEEKGVLPPGVIADTVADTLKESGVTSGPVGVDLLRLPVPFHRRLVELLPDVEWVSADAELRRLRMVKTEDEIERIREAASRTDRAVGAAFDEVRAGQTELDLGAAIQRGVLENGCELITTVFIGAGERAAAITAPGENVMNPGDIVRFDLNSVYRGYFCDIGRMAVVGEPDEDQVRAYAGHIELRNRIFEFIRPGRTCAEVHAHYVKQAEDLALERFIYPYIGIGHGTGVNNDEYPKLNATDPTVIEAGMVLNVEPDTRGPGGEIFHVEDMILVGDDGVEVLTWSRDWTEIPVISA